MKLKRFLNDFNSIYNNNQESYIWKRLWTLAESDGACYFVEYPDEIHQDLLGVFYTKEAKFYLYIPNNITSPTGYLNQFIHDTPLYRSCIYPPNKNNVKWPEVISMFNYGFILWPANFFDDLLLNLSSYKASPIQIDVDGKGGEDVINKLKLSYEASPIQTVTAGEKLEFNKNELIVHADTANSPDMSTVHTYKNKKENDKMDTSNIINFDFGPAGSAFRFSPYGVAVHVGENWIVYNANTNEMMNVNVFNFKMDNFIYKMPVAISALSPGDLIIHQRIPMFVRSVDNVAGTVEAINYKDSTVASILPVKSPFGFNFVTKITSLVDFSNVNADNDNPFGNVLPMMMLANSDDNNDNLLPLMFMMNGQMNMDNPLMMYFLLKDSDNNNNILPMLLMSQYINK